MNIPEAIQMGNPVLRLISQPVHESEFDSEGLHELIKSLFITMAHKKGVGIAAPQLGINKRIFVFGLDDKVNPIPHTAIINPTFQILDSDIEEGYEGCLSVGTVRGKVPRSMRIHYKGLDIKGNHIEREAEGLHARVVQHEYDHLDGILFIDRIKDYSSIGFYDELIAAGILSVKREAT